MPFVNDIWKTMSSLSPAVYISVIAGIVAILDLFVVDVTWVTVSLIFIAAIPWITNAQEWHKYIDRFKLPGGLEVSLREASHEAKGLPVVDLENDTTDDLRAVIEGNPTLVLVGYRIEIEKKLNTLLRLANLDSKKTYSSIQKKVRLLQENEILEPTVSAVLHDLSPALNRAAHDAVLKEYEITWANEAALPLIRVLDKKISDMQRTQK